MTKSEKAAIKGLRKYLGLNNGTAKALQNLTVKLNQELGIDPTPENNEKLPMEGYKAIVNKRRGRERSKEKCYTKRLRKNRQGDRIPFDQIVDTDFEWAKMINERDQVRVEGDSLNVETGTEYINAVAQGKKPEDQMQFQRDVKEARASKKAFGEFGFKVYSGTKSPGSGA